MSILNFTATRFRSLRNVSDWKPSRLNVLIGPNGSGKSNILKAIELLAGSAQGRLGRMVQSAGGMESQLWDGQEKDFGFALEYSYPGHAENPKIPGLNYHLRLDRLGAGADYSIGLERFSSWHDVKQNTPNQRFVDLDRDSERVMFRDDFDEGDSLLPEDIPTHETILSLAKGPFADRALSHFRSQLASFAVHHGFHTGRESAVRQSVITRYETRVDADGQNLISVLHTLYTGDRDFKNEVNQAMSAAFGDDFEELVFPPAADQRIQLRIRWRSLSREQSAADLSDGTLRFLFLLTVLGSPNPAPVIAIDEPETGLHPSMLPIIAEYAVQASQKVQVILTTHSPQFLDAFTETRPDTTVVRRTNGETSLHQLDGDILERWLEEYSLGSLHRSGELEELAL